MQVARTRSKSEGKNRQKAIKREGSHLSEGQNRQKAIKSEGSHLPFEGPCCVWEATKLQFVIRICHFSIFSARCCPKYGVFLMGVFSGNVLEKKKKETSLEILRLGG